MTTEEWPGDWRPRRAISDEEEGADAERAGLVRLRRCTYAEHMDAVYLASQCPADVHDTGWQAKIRALLSLADELDSEVAKHPARPDFRSGVRFAASMARRHADEYANFYDPDEVGAV